ncbi:MAG: hypothetical protein MI974_07260 [Chitinophagales bacterium]|nr:hypothetical protein [Chitinophagales bacterium]
MSLTPNPLMKEILAHEKEMRSDFHKLLTSKKTETHEIENFIETLEANYNVAMKNLIDEDPGHLLASGYEGTLNKNIICFDTRIQHTLLKKNMSPDEVRSYLTNLVHKLQQAENQIKSKTYQEVQWDTIHQIFSTVRVIGTGYGVGTAFLSTTGKAFLYLVVAYGTAAALAVFAAALALAIAIIIAILKFVANTVTCEFLTINFADHDLIIEEKCAVDGLITYVPSLNMSQYGIPRMRYENGRSCVYGDFIKARKRYGSLYGATGGFRFSFYSNPPGNPQLIDSFLLGYYNGNKSSSKNGINVTHDRHKSIHNLEKWIKGNWKSWRGDTHSGAGVVNFNIDARKGGEVGGIITTGF